MHFSTYNTVLHKNQFTTTRWTMEPSLMLLVRRSAGGRITHQTVRGSGTLVYTIQEILEVAHVPVSVITSCFVLQDIVQPQCFCIPIPIKFFALVGLLWIYIVDQYAVLYTCRLREYGHGFSWQRPWRFNVFFVRTNCNGMSFVKISTHYMRL